MTATPKGIFGTALASQLPSVLLILGCSPSFIVLPANGGDVGNAAHAGVSLNAEPNAWSATPEDLAQYLTPIWIQLINRRTDEVRVMYADFALTNDSGFRYAAISPYPRQTTKVSAQAPAATLRHDQASNQTGFNSSSVGHHAARSPNRATLRVSDWYFDKPGSADEQAQFIPTDSDIAKVQFVRGHMTHGGGFGGTPHHSSYARPGGSSHGHVHGGVWFGGGYYGPAYAHGYWGHYSPWPYYYAWPPYYGSYVYYWNGRYYPALPTEDVMRYGLPEGVLHPGGSISGFVYFQHAATREGRLDLTWSASSLDGKAIATLRVPLVVVED